MNPATQMAAHESRRFEPWRTPRARRLYIANIHYARMILCAMRREAPDAVILPFKLPLAEVARTKAGLDAFEGRAK